MNILSQNEGYVKKKKSVFSTFWETHLLLMRLGKKMRKNVVSTNTGKEGKLFASKKENYTLPIQ